MRIRVIRKPRSLCIDGVDVSRFEVGFEYQVGNSLGALFFAEKWAVPVASDEPAILTPLSELSRDRRRLRRRSPASRPNVIRDPEPLYMSADRPRRKRRR